MAELQPIIKFYDRNFVRHLGICNPICVKLLQIVYGVIPRNVEKTDLYLRHSESYTLAYACHSLL